MAVRTGQGWRIVAIIIMGVGCAVAAITGVRVAVDEHYEGRALPGTQVAGIDVSGMTTGEIHDLLARRVAAMTVTFDYNGTTVEASAADAGVEVDVAAATQAALEAKRDAGLASKYSSDKTENIAITPTVDSGKLHQYLAGAFASVTTKPVDARITPDAQAAAFSVVPGVDGSEIDASNIDGTLEEQAASLAAAKIPLNVQSVVPKVTSAQAQEVADQLNANLDKEYSLTLNGKTVETLDRATVASWIQISDDGLTPTANEAAIAQYITDTVAPDVAKDPVEQVKWVTKTGEFVRYQTKGVPGRGVSDVPALAVSVGNAILSGENTAVEVPVTEVPFTEKTVVQPDKLIVVDLSSQTTTLYEDDKQIASYLISSGKPGYATPKGTFYVRAHVREQTMRGSNNDGTTYETPNVQWVTYFNGDVAFHATYWHNNFGHPMSHGCINMQTAAAKVVYDWAEIGTKVVVQ